MINIYIKGLVNKTNCLNGLFLKIFQHFNKLTTVYNYTSYYHYKIYYFIICYVKINDDLYT